MDNVLKLSEDKKRGKATDNNELDKVIDYSRSNISFCFLCSKH